MLHVSTASEYLRQPAPQTRYASQLGHMCRILEIQHSTETILQGGSCLPLWQQCTDMSTWLGSHERWARSHGGNLCLATQAAGEGVQFRLVSL